MSATAEAFADQTAGQAPVRGFLHRAGKFTSDVLVLTHGAGGNCNAPLLVALAQVFAEAGVSVLRCDLPFRQRRPHGPPSGSGKLDQEGLRRAAELMQRECGGSVFLGGQSYGGRMASILLAESPETAIGLLLLSYPLHPPGKPEQKRTAHLPNVKARTLFVSGTKDPFGSIEEIDEARALIPAPAKLLTVQGAGHSLSAKGKPAELAVTIAQTFYSLFR